MYSNQISSPAPILLQNKPAARLSQIADHFALRWLRQNALALVAVLVTAAVSFMAFSQSSAPNIPAIALSADPLYAATSGDKPTLALALSVEFPTVGAQYVDPDNNGTTDDVTYSPTIEYLGYYDAESCYTYDDAGTGAPSGQTSNYKRFVRRGPAIPLATPNDLNPTWTSRMCWNGSKSYSKDDGTTPAYNTTSSDAFSGNFLNWASNSAIDMLRLSLTGGDRVIDTPTLTVLQRAVIPDGDPISMGNSSNFPSKRLYRSGTSRAITSTNFAAASYASGVSYFGAIPSVMATAAGSNDIFVANTLNRIYFGTSRTSDNNVSSSGLTGYTLGSSGGSATNAMGTITTSTESVSSGSSYQIGTFTKKTDSKPNSTYCVDSGNTCNLPAGTWEIWYGKDNSWQVGPATGAVPCNKDVLGDPSISSKKCYYKAYTGPWAPTPTLTKCADENGTCTLPSGTWEVLYGANNSWKVAPATGTVACTNTVWGDPIPGTYKGCYYRAYTGSWTTTTGLNSEGYFFARVQVCDRDANYISKEQRSNLILNKKAWDLCTQYSDGASPAHATYKPTGVIQKYSDQLRLAAFGYLLDQTASYSSGRYGGVLRAPMKYVGAKKYDASGTPLSGGNPGMEWDAVTGVFNPNPDNNSTVPTTDGRGTYLSGVISYVNQFGRTGSVLGRYKKYDPIGELHYETLRYLQGLSPSADAISNITTDMYDGYPVAYNATTGWTDPYGDGRTKDGDYSCTKSNIVAIGDKNTHDGNREPTPSDANNIPDIKAWRTVVQNFENNVTTATYVDGSGTTRNIANPNGANTANPGVPTDTATSQIMGSAYWARTHDIRGTTWANATSTGEAGTTLQRPGLRVKTFMFDVNEYGASNDATTRHTSNQLFMAAKYGGFEADPANPTKNPYNTYGNPFVNEKDGTNNNDVWRDTDPRPSRVGEANTYFLQSDARGVLSAFNDIFSRASTSAYNIGGGANNNKNTYSSNSTIYQGKFDTSDWSGDIEAWSTVTQALTWSAATQLKPTSSRTIVVGKVATNVSPAATDFTWNAIETSLQTNLNASDGLGADRLNYLRGDKSKEGSPFRTRAKLLGDIINSGVVYSGQPSTAISSSSYASFASTNANRTPAVFAGANDGMLHAFNANTGDELFAYIPSWLGPKLAALTNITYGKNSTTPHQSYVDSMPEVAEAQVGSAGTAADWKTVLVGGTGGGGQGVFALDVTDPTAFSAAKVMWEFTHADDRDLGNVMGKPQILKLRTNAYDATTPTYKWFAVVASGVNNYVTANSAGQFSPGNPVLFLLDLSKPIGTAWSLGDNYYKITLPVDSTLSASKPTGLINFTVELGFSGEVALIYMGDLHGNLWKLDFSLSAGSSAWTMATLSSFNKGTIASPAPYPLFIAKDASGKVQPITAAPVTAPGPDTGTRYVFFGTGKYYELADKTSTTTQTEYMVFDTGATSGDSSPVGASAISGRARLKQGTATVSTGLIVTPAFTLGLATTNSDTEAVRSGWYADLPTSGERQISEAALPRFSNTLLFVSMYPGASGGSGCSTGSDGGHEYTLDIATGNGTFSDSVVGLPGDIMLIDRTDLTVKTAPNNTRGYIKISISDKYELGSLGKKKTGTVTTPAKGGRLSWRQINNYHDL